VTTTTYPWARLIPREVHLRTCGNCNKRTPTLGSRLRRVDGVRNDKPIASPDERTKLAADFADAALREACMRGYV